MCLFSSQADENWQWLVIYPCTCMHRSRLQAQLIRRLTGTVKERCLALICLVGKPLCLIFPSFDTHTLGSK
ncbi:hypothetical protein ABKN59_008842 [Abortiporus biennis]